MSKNVLAALSLASLLLPSLARADGSVPDGPPAKLIPSEVAVIVGVDLPQLRAAGPAETVNMLIEGLRPIFAKVGADPGKLGLAVLGVQPRAVDTKSATVIVADLPLDGPALEKMMESPWGSREYLGVKIRHNNKDTYAILPHDRFILTEGMKIERVIDLARGKGAALVDKNAAALLRRVGATGGRGPAVFGWLKLDAMKETLGQQAPKADEAAMALTTGPSGADLKIIAHCPNKEAVDATADALRTIVASAAKDSTVALMGLTSIVNAVKVDTTSDAATVALHMTRAQYVDLVTRFAGLAQSSLQDLQRGPASPPPPSDEIRVKPKAKTQP